MSLRNSETLTAIAPENRRKIIHVDMDAFYASIEQNDHPEYRGKPLVVGGKSGRGVIAAASYEARAFGIHSAMPAKQAIKLCENLIFAPPRFDRYREVSRQIREIFYRYTDKVEPLALDEAFLDVTENHKNIPLAMDVAIAIKQEIFENLGLTASAGVSYNKFLAKVASDLRKPDGLSIIHPDNAQSFIETLPIEDFFGVGKVTAKRMHELGIKNGKDLYAWSEAALIEEFGKAGHSYYLYARAEDDREVDPNRIRKSVGVEETFLEDLTTKEEILEEIELILEELIRRCRKNDFYGRTLTLKIKYADFRQVTRSRTLNFALGDDLLILWPIMLSLLEQVTLKPRYRIRLIGLTIHNIDQDKHELNNELNQLELPFTHENA